MNHLWEVRRMRPMEVGEERGQVRFMENLNEKVANLTIT
jgi:hypothetical protein